MDIRKLQRVIVDGLEDVKVQHILVFNTEHLSSLFERVIIASGTSNRQTKSLASSVREAVKGAGFPVPRTEGETNGEWIIVDCGAAVVHVMQPTIRDFYRLEEIWGDKPVRMKIESGAPKLVKAASENDDEDADQAKSKAVRRTAAKRAAPVASSSAPPSAEAWTRGPAAKTGARAGARSAVVAKARAAKAGVEKTAAAEAGALKAGARKADTSATGASRKTPAKAPARKVVAMPGAAAKKAAAKKAAPQRLVTRVVGLKKPPAKKAAAKTGVASRKTAGRTFGATTAPPRAPAKKSPTGA